MLKQALLIVFVSVMSGASAVSDYSKPYYDRKTKTFSHFEEEKAFDIAHNETYAVNGFYQWFYPVPHRMWESAFIFLETKIKGPDLYYVSDNQIDAWQISQKPYEKSEDPVITWIGHATFLIQARGLNIITDPVFGDLSLLYPRNAPPGISFEKLPKIDIILISHAHRDHFDKASLDMIIKRDNPLVFLPKKTVRKCSYCSLQDVAVKQCMPCFNMKNVAQYSWWEGYTDIKDNVSISFTFVPAHHWSGLCLVDTNRSLWGGWSIIVKNLQTQKGLGIYFAGDTAYKETLFKKIAQHFSSKDVGLDVALLPIGPNEPRELLEDSHMSAQDAVAACVLLNAKKFIPMHFGTFRLGTDDFIAPIKRLTECSLNKKLGGRVALLKFGQRVGV